MATDFFPFSSKFMLYPNLFNASYLSIYLSINLCIYLYIHLSINLCIYLFIYLSIHPSIHLFIHLSVYLSIFPSISINLSIYLSIHLSMYVPVYLSIYPSIYILYLVFASTHFLSDLLLILHCGPYRSFLFQSYTDFACFGINIELTDEGVKHIDDVVACVFAYIGQRGEEKITRFYFSMFFMCLTCDNILFYNSDKWGMLDCLYIPDRELI